MHINDIYKKYRLYISITLLAVVLFFIGKFVSGIDFSKLNHYLSDMPYMFLAIIAVTCCAYLSGTMAWVLCVKGDTDRLNFTEMFIIKHICETLTVFNPTGIIAGDTLKLKLFSRKGIDTQNGLSSILLSRMLVLFSGIFLIIVSVVYLAVFKASEQLNFYVVSLGIVALLLLCYGLTALFLSRNLYLGKIVGVLRKKTGWKFLSEKTEESAYEVNRLLSSSFFENRIRFMGAFSFSAMQWIFGAIEFYLILSLLGIEVHVFDCIAIEMGVMFFKTLGSIVPGQLGFEEYGNKIMLGAVGIVGEEVWLIVSVMRRARQLFWLFVAGLFSLIISKFSPIKVYK